MDASSVRNLCQYLITSAVQRCRMSGELCRLSVALKSCQLPDRVQISISDTGTGSCLEALQGVKYPSDSSLNEMLDGVISVATTSLSDNEIFYYKIDLRQKDCMKRLINLTPGPKNGATFSGTEVSFATFLGHGDILPELTCFLRKMLILRIPKVGIELMVDKASVPESQCVNVIMANKCIDSPSEADNAGLKLGLVDYVLRHENQIDDACHSCFPTGKHLKTGSGEVCSKNNRNIETVIEAVVIISELSESTSPSCFRTCGSKTEVLYFYDFSPGSISQSLLNALTSIDWRSYGLSIKCISDIDGCAFVEWENLPPNSHIDIAIHCHHTKPRMPPAKEKNIDRNLTKKAVKLALTDLKEKNAGVLLSAHAVKIQSYAPDLARTIAGLISTSNDSNFIGECGSLLGLSCHDAESFEECIKERLVSVIQMNDREPHRNREAAAAAAPFLFQDDCFQEPDFANDDYEEEGEPTFSSLDI